MGPLKAEEVRANHITVSWKKPTSDGGSELTGYIVEKMDMDSGRWVLAGEVNTTKLSAPGAIVINPTTFLDRAGERRVHPYQFDAEKEIQNSRQGREQRRRIGTARNDRGDFSQKPVRYVGTTTTCHVPDAIGT